MVLILVILCVCFQGDWKTSSHERGEVCEVFVMEEFSSQFTNRLQNCCRKLQLIPGRVAARPCPASSMFPPGCRRMETAHEEVENLLFSEEESTLRY